MFLTFFMMTCHDCARDTKRACFGIKFPLMIVCKLIWFSFLVLLCNIHVQHVGISLYVV